MQILCNECYFTLLLVMDLSVPLLTPLGAQIHNHSTILTNFGFLLFSGEKGK